MRSSLPATHAENAATTCTLDLTRPGRIASVPDLRRRLWLIFGFVFIDVMGWSLVIALIPYYASSLGARLSTAGLISAPPSTVPRMIEPTVVPSIQPLAATIFSGGNSSVRMPYLAGE